MTKHQVSVFVFGGPDEIPELKRVLACEGCELFRTTKSEELLQLLEDTAVDLVLLILSKGRPERIALLRDQDACCQLPPVVVLTDCFDVDLYLEALRLGAFDGLGVPLDSKELVRVLRAAVAEARSRRKVLAATA